MEGNTVAASFLHRWSAFFLNGGYIVNWVPHHDVR